MLLVRDKKNHGKFPGGEVSVVAMGHGALGVSYGEPQNPICTYYIYMYVYTINGIYCNGDIVYIIIWMNYNDLSVTSQYHLNILETLFHLLRVARVTTKKITAVGNLF